MAQFVKSCKQTPKMSINRFDYGQNAYFLLQIHDDEIAIATIYGVVGVDIMIRMRIDAIRNTGGRCVISDMSHCVITVGDEIGALFGMVEAGGARDMPCAWVVPAAGARPWRTLSARMAYLGYSRRVFTALPAAHAWVRRELLLPAFEDHPHLLRC